MDLRESSAPEDPRVRLAGERTLLAWVRTGLALMGFGFVVARFGLFLREFTVVQPERPAASTGLSLGIGMALVLLGVAVNLIASYQHYHFLRRLERGDPRPVSRWSLGIIVAGILAALGLSMTAYLVFLDQ
jgi:putative membrane protein